MPKRIGEAKTVEQKGDIFAQITMARHGEKKSNILSIYITTWTKWNEEDGKSEM